MPIQTRRTRLAPEQRRKQLLDAAIDLALKANGDYKEVNHAAVQKVVGCSLATVFNYFKRIEDLHEAICQEAWGLWEEGNFDTYRYIVAFMTMRGHDLTENEVSFSLCDIDGDVIW